LNILLFKFGVGAMIPREVLNPKIFGDEASLPAIEKCRMATDWIYICHSYFGHWGSIAIMWYKSCNNNFTRFKYGTSPIDVCPNESLGTIETVLAHLPVIEGESRRARYVRAHEQLSSLRVGTFARAAEEIALKTEPTICEEMDVSAAEFQRVKLLVSQLGDGMFDPWQNGPVFRLIACDAERKIDFRSDCQDESSSGHRALQVFAELFSIAELKMDGGVIDAESTQGVNSIQ